MRIKEIQSLIKFVAKSGASEVSLEMKDVKITIKTSSDKAPVVIQNPVVQPPQLSDINVVSPSIVSPPAVVPAVAIPPSAAEEESNLITVKSPIIGTFYRKPAPDKPVFVEIGDTVSEGSVLCVIEAMKLFNEIESEVTGKIVKILVDDSSPVEFDQPLFLVDPS
jgi:acetyl-CoA carboxylase biotin carboxyl carrier protein